MPRTAIFARLAMANRAEREKAKACERRSKDFVQRLAV
jgi:hypothetical protein